MRFLKYIVCFLIAVFTSFYLFPFTFRFFSIANTKMVLAGVGLVLYIINLSKGRTGSLDRSLFFLSITALIVSFIACVSAIVNNTNDYTYASYVISMWVWLGGGYAVVNLMKWRHGYVTVDLVFKYLLAVCVLQCILALIIDANISFKMLVDSMVADLGFIQMDRLDDSNRLYGIGCSLDVAGTRFAAILAMTPFMTYKASCTNNIRDVWMILIAFVFVSIVGNMIARTSTIGILIAVLMWITIGVSPAYNRSIKGVWGRLLVIILIALIASVILYNTSYIFKSNIRFAFEGFFNLFETGHWETNSNNALMNMFVFPDNIHTWIIGDGYLYDPAGINPYYVGENYPGYYKDTDVGYLRFIFYFGLIGLVSIVGYFVIITKLLSKRFPNYKQVFYVLLLINLIVWIKVSTDIFPVYAILFCIPIESAFPNLLYEKQYEDSLPDPLDI